MRTKHETDLAMPPDDGAEAIISAALSQTVPRATTDFQAQLEAQLLQKLAGVSRPVPTSEAEAAQISPVVQVPVLTLLPPANHAIKSNGAHTHQIPRTARPIRWLFQYRTAIAALVAVVLTGSVFVAFPSLAQNLTQFFQRNPSDLKTETVTMSGNELVEFYERIQEEGGYRTVAEAQAQVDYTIYAPDLRGLYLQKIAVDPETQAVTQTYFVPDNYSPNGIVWVTFTQTPATSYVPPEVGASAEVTEISVGEKYPGVYVTGNYAIRPQSWRLTYSNRQIQMEDVRKVPADGIITMEYESVWNGNPTWQQAAWQQGDMVYRLESSWSMGVLDIRTLADRIATRSPAYLLDLIGLPVGLPEAYYGWFENVTYYDDRPAVVYEYRDEDWFVFISEAAPNDLVFTRPEVIKNTLESIRVGEAIGEYAEGRWLTMLPSRGSIRPFTYLSGEILGEETHFQWVRWQTGDLVHEVAVFNGCQPSEKPRPCYSRDELVALAANLTFTTPNYSQRMLMQAPLRASMNAADMYQARSMVVQTPFIVKIPRHSRDLAWPYRMFWAEYSLRSNMVWQLYTRDPDEVYYFPKPLPDGFNGPALVIFQKVLDGSETGSYSGCELPADVQTEIILSDDIQRSYITGTWGEGTIPFSGNEGLCLPNQHFQIIQWQEGDMGYEILAIDTDDLSREALLHLAGSLVPVPS